MKAIVYRQYGPPEVAKLTDIEKPVPKANELLIKVHASTVNRTDSGFRSAEYVVSRLFSGIWRPKLNVLGCEFAGIVEEIGAKVTQFKVGDKIFGFNDQTFGGHAEYMVQAENAPIAHIPKGYTLEQAAPLTEGSHYALCNIRASGIQAGQHALVYGATGAIGSAAVQLLKHFGVKVTAVCNTKNVELVRSLGADEVIDYQTQDFTKTTSRFDFVFDAVGKSSFGACKPLMNKNAVYISTELGKRGENIYLALLKPFMRGPKVLFPLPSISKADVQFLAELAEKGIFRPVIDRTYQMQEIVEAYKYAESGQKTGNLVLRIQETDFT